MTTDALTPVQIATNVKAIAAGYMFSAFIKTDNTLWVAGRKQFRAKLGDGTTATRPTPFQLATGITAASAGEGYLLFTKSDGSLWGTGLNGNGQFGNGNPTTVSTPVQLATGTVLAPAVPAGLTASPAATLDRVHLLWGARGRRHGLRGLAQHGQRSTATRLVQNVRWAIYEDMSAVNGQGYYYWIKAVNRLA